MRNVIILQRVVPHYRIPVFRRLHEELGWKVACASNPPEGSHLKVFLDEEYILPYRFRFSRNGSSYRCTVPLRKILRDNNPDAVIAEFSLSMSSTYGLALRHLLGGTPATLFWSHGYGRDRGSNSARVKVREYFRRIVLRRSKGHICYSAEGQAFLEKHTRSLPLFLARNTLDVETIRRHATGHHPATDGNGMNVLTVSRLTPEKNLPMLIRAVKALHREMPRLSLTIVGDGPDLPRIRTACGEALGDYVHMPGALYEESDLAPYFNRADVVVFPGAAGLSVNHALAYGVPVVAFERRPDGPAHGPEIENVIDGLTGVRVKNYGESALGSALRDLFEKHQSPRKAFTESIRRYVDENLSIEVMLDGFRSVNTYLDTLNGLE